MRLPDINDLIQDLQLAKEMAINNQNPNALVIATIAQAKLLGLDKPINDVNANEVQTISNLMDELANDEPPNVRRVIVDKVQDYSMLNDDELRQLIAITEKMEKVTAYD